MESEYWQNWLEYMAYQDELDRNAKEERDCINDIPFDSNDVVPSDQYPVPFDMVEP